MEYRKRYISESEFVWEQVYDNGNIRTVSAERPALLQWIAEGNTPVEIPYVSPPLPDLAAYKEQKKRELNQIFKQNLVTALNSDPDMILFDLISRSAKGLALMDKKVIKKIDLSAAEEQLLSALETMQAGGEAIRLTLESKKAQVDAAVDHAAVDAIIWE